MMNTNAYFIMRLKIKLFIGAAVMAAPFLFTY